MPSRRITPFNRVRMLPWKRLLHVIILSTPLTVSLTLPLFPSLSPCPLPRETIHDVTVRNAAAVCTLVLKYFRWHRFLFIYIHCCSAKAACEFPAKRLFLVYLYTIRCISTIFCHRKTTNVSMSTIFSHFFFDQAHQFTLL